MSQGINIMDKTKNKKQKQKYIEMEKKNKKREENENRKEKVMIILGETNVKQQDGFTSNKKLGSRPFREKNKKKEEC